MNWLCQEERKKDGEREGEGREGKRGEGGREGERWSVRESRLREIKRKMEREKSRVWKVSLNIPSNTVKWRGTERRGALEL